MRRIKIGLAAAMLPRMKAFSNRADILAGFSLGTDGTLAPPVALFPLLA
jgi:hypothetical protein